MSAEVPCLGRLLLPAWAACPGYALLGSLLPGFPHPCLPLALFSLNLFLSLSSLFFFSFSFSLLLFFSPLFFLFPPRIISSHPLLYLSTFLFLSCLFSVSLFWSLSFSFSLFLMFLSFPLSFSTIASFCVSLSILKVQQLRDKSALTQPWEGWPCPSEGVEGAHFKQDG